MPMLRMIARWSTLSTPASVALRIADWVMPLRERSPIAVAVPVAILAMPTALMPFCATAWPTRATLAPLFPNARPMFTTNVDCDVASPLVIRADWMTPVVPCAPTTRPLPVVIATAEPDPGRGPKPAASAPRGPAPATAPALWPEFASATPMSITSAIWTMWIWPASRAFAWTCWVTPVWASTPVAFAPPVPTLTPGFAAPEVAGGAPAGGTCDVTPTALLAPDCDTATPVFPTVACWVPVDEGAFCDGAAGGVAGVTGG